MNWIPRDLLHVGVVSIEKKVDPCVDLRLGSVEGEGCHGASGITKALSLTFAAERHIPPPFAGVECGDAIIGPS